MSQYNINSLLNRIEHKIGEEQMVVCWNNRTVGEETRTLYFAISLFIKKKRKIVYFSRIPVVLKIYFLIGAKTLLFINQFLTPKKWRYSLGREKRYKVRSFLMKILKSSIFGYYTFKYHKNYHKSILFWLLQVPNYYILTFNIKIPIPSVIWVKSTLLNTYLMYT